MLYTTIIHELREKYHLTIPEYCVLDAVRFLSNNPKAPVSGWCNASKSAIAEMLGLSKAFIVGTINKLIEIHLLEKNDDGRLVRITELYFDDLASIGQDVSNGKASDRSPGKPSDRNGKASDRDRSDKTPNRSDTIPPSNTNEIHSETKKETKGAGAPLVPPFGSDEWNMVWEEWIQFRKEKKNKLLPSTIKYQYKQLAAKNETEAIAMIRQSIEKGWTGLFDLKDKVISIDDLNPLCKALIGAFEDYYQIRTTFTFTWNKTEDVAGILELSEIFKKRLTEKKVVPTDEAIVNAFNHFLSKMPDFYQKRSLTPDLIYQNFNKIITEITHGTSVSQNNQQSASQYV